VRVKSNIGPMKLDCNFADAADEKGPYSIGRMMVVLLSTQTQIRTKLKFTLASAVRFS